MKNRLKNVTVNIASGGGGRNGISDLQNTANPSRRKGESFMYLTDEELKEVMLGTIDRIFSEKNPAKAEQLDRRLQAFWRLSLRQREKNETRR